MVTSGGSGIPVAEAEVRQQPRCGRSLRTAGDPRGGCAEPRGSEEHADPPGSRLALPPAGGTDGRTAGCLKDVPDVILVPGRAFHVGHGADLPGHGLSLRGQTESDSPGTPVSHYPVLGATLVPSRPVLPGGDTHLLAGHGLYPSVLQLLQHLLVLPQVRLAAHQQHRDALAEVVHLRVPL